MIIDSNIIRWVQCPQSIGYPSLKPNVRVGDRIRHNGAIGEVISIWYSGSITCRTTAGEYLSIEP